MRSTHLVGRDHRVDPGPLSDRRCECAVLRPQNKDTTERSADIV
jgi:hypothetical protein